MAGAVLRLGGAVARGAPPALHEIRLPVLQAARSHWSGGRSTGVLARSRRRTEPQEVEDGLRRAGDAGGLAVQPYTRGRVLRGALAVAGRRHGLLVWGEVQALVDEDMCGVVKDVARAAPPMACPPWSVPERLWLMVL